jgi:hypothetical protein
LALGAESDDKTDNQYGGAGQKPFNGIIHFHPGDLFFELLGLLSLFDQL